MQLRLVVQYDGTAYEGWQLQPSAPTVQGELERALAVVLRTPVRVRGAGRTDAGVHARGQVAAVRVARLPDDLDRVRASVNAVLAPDVVVAELTAVDDAFDPRRDARSRCYEYRIWNAAAPSPFWRRWSWHVRAPLEIDMMGQAAAALRGRHDFAGFRGADAEPVRSTVRWVLQSEVGRAGALVVYRVEATAFLKHMVRNVVGTLVEIGRGARPASSLADVLASGDRRVAGPTAPPHGLILARVRYEDTGAAGSSEP